MSVRILTVILLLLVGIGDGPDQEGRRGNALYADGAYTPAVDAYLAGLGLLEADEQGRTRYGLLNNLGAALHKLGQHDEARQAFDQALSLSGSEADFARTAYNAGNNAYATQQLEAALDLYKRALLADPDNEDAQFNYEYVKRQLEEQQDQQDQQDQQQGGDGTGPSPQNQPGQNSPDQENQQQQSGQPEEQQDEQGRPEEGQDQQQQGGDQQQQGRAPAPDPTKISREQAERILQALEDDEERLLREVQPLKGRPRRVEKDW